MTANGTDQKISIQADGKSIIWTINFTDAQGFPDVPAAPPTFRFLKNGALLESRVGNMTDAGYGQVYNNLSAGTYQGIVDFLLDSGLQASAPSAQVTITAPTQTPVVSAIIMSDTRGWTITPGQFDTLNILVQNSTGGAAAGVALDLYFNGVRQGVLPGVTNASGLLSYGLTVPQTTQIFVRAQGTSVQSNTQTLTVTSAPSTGGGGTVSFTSPSAGGQIPVGQPATLTGTATAPSGKTITTVEVRLELPDRSAGTSYVLASGTSNWSATVTSNNTNYTSERVRVTYSDGTQAGFSNVITYSNPLPPPPDSTPASITATVAPTSGTIDNTVFTFSGTVKNSAGAGLNGVGVGVEMDGTPSGVPIATTNASGNFQTTSTFGTAGSHTFTFYVLSAPTVRTAAPLTLTLSAPQPTPDTTPAVVTLAVNTNTGTETAAFTFSGRVTTQSGQNAPGVALGLSLDGTDFPGTVTTTGDTGLFLTQTSFGVGNHAIRFFVVALPGVRSPPVNITVTPQGSGGTVPNITTTLYRQDGTPVPASGGTVAVNGVLTLQVQGGRASYDYTVVLNSSANKTLTTNVNGVGSATITPTSAGIITLRVADPQDFNAAIGTLYTVTVSTSGTGGGGGGGGGGGTQNPPSGITWDGVIAGLPWLLLTAGLFIPEKYNFMNKGQKAIARRVSKAPQVTRVGALTSSKAFRDFIRRQVKQSKGRR